jgi:hypothetical protein
VRWLNSLNYDYLKLKKEEVIYKGSVYTNTRVLLLYTAYASRASARDHVTWNASARTVTKTNLKGIYNILLITNIPLILKL